MVRSVPSANCPPGSATGVCCELRGSVAHPFPREHRHHRISSAREGHRSRSRPRLRPHVERPRASPRMLSFALVARGGRARKGRTHRLLLPPGGAHERSRRSRGTAQACHPGSTENLVTAALDGAPIGLASAEPRSQVERQGSVDRPSPERVQRSIRRPGEPQKDERLAQRGSLFGRAAVPSVVRARTISVRMAGSWTSPSPTACRWTGIDMHASLTTAAWA